MSNARRQFSAEQKLQILQKADQGAITQTIRRHNLPHSVYYRWKRPFNTGGASLIKLQFNKAEPELRALQEENAKLKKIIGNRPWSRSLRTALL